MWTSSTSEVRRWPISDFLLFRGCEVEEVEASAPSWSSALRFDVSLCLLRLLHRLLAVPQFPQGNQDLQEVVACAPETGVPVKKIRTDTVNIR